MNTVELPASELRYRRLFEAAHDGILIVDPETRRIIDVNPFLEGFLGFAKDEFIGKELYQIGLLRDETANQDAFRELQINGYIRYDDLPLQTKDGRRVDVEFVSNLYQEGDQSVIQCNIRDISARKRIEADLRESEERFKLVARAVSDVVWDWNILTDRLWWSDGFRTAFGYSNEEIDPGIEAWISRIHPDERQHIVNGFQHNIDCKAESWKAEYRFRHKNGSYVFVQDSGYIVRNKAGKGVRMVGGMHDLTEQKKMESQYLRSQRMESIGTLASGIAHDLNNVLSPIMMSIELLKLDSENNARRSATLESIDCSCHRGSDLVRQLLSFARGLDGQRVTVRLRDLIDDLNKIISETFSCSIEIVIQVPHNLWPVIGDPVQLHQVLLNLAINARDAMPNGGTLTLAASNITLDPQPTSAGGQTNTGRHVLLSVQDTGIGIPLEIRERIFEPFFTTKEFGKGTGLGLATVHTVIKSHGGFVTIDSEQGLGSTFSIYLPADPSLKTASSDPVPSDLPRGRNELVLVVDDNPSIRLVMQQTLETFGYRVISAANGAEAITLYSTQAQHIALVITDMMMPIMDGASSVQVLMSLNPQVKVIAVSGLEGTDYTSRVASAGVRDFLLKPYTARTLIRLVREVLDRPVHVPALMRD